MRTAVNGHVEIAYEQLGRSDGPPLLLVAGAAMAADQWPDGFVDAVVDRGFRVIRFDNRDSGHSTHLTGGGRSVTRPGPAVYSLRDMAADAVAVLDAAGVASANVLGISLGGMVAQVMAVHHPSRVRTLISTMSAPSAAYRPKFGPVIRMARLARNVDRGRISAEEAVLGVARIAGSPGYPLDEQWLRETARRAGKYPQDEGKNIRQTAAVRSSGDRTAELGRITAPTLVLHGEADPLFPVRGGRATADAVPGARFVAYPGMGHDLPRALWPAFVDEIASLATPS